MLKSWIWVAFFLALTACLPFNGFDAPDDCLEEGFLFVDDFEEEKNCGWRMTNQGGTLTDISEGALQISVSETGQVWWTNPGKQFDDAIINVQARQVAGQDDNAYGVICRYQNPENFYLFLISGDGYYAIGKYVSGSTEVQILSGDGQFKSSDAINQGIATNFIRVGCIGNELSLSVNGLPLETVQDNTFVVGDVGLAASAFQPGSVSVAFDNIQIAAP